MNDKLFSNIVRLQYFYEQGIVLPALPGAGTTPKQELTSSEQELKEQILDEVAEALLLIHGKRGVE